MSSQKFTAKVKDVFNTVATGYDNPSLRFFVASAEHLTTLLTLSGDEQVVDIACGTGHVSVAVAQQLSTGHVTAVDLSQGMLEQAQKKAEARNIDNVTFVCRDMQQLSTNDAAYDVAICSFGIFFAEDTDAQLRRIVDLVKPGGKVVISTFSEKRFFPLADMFVERAVRLGAQPHSEVWKKTATEEGCRDFFEDNGLVDVSVSSKNLGYYLQSENQWWDLVYNAGFRGLIEQLDVASQQQFKDEHLDEIRSLHTAEGIWLDVPALYTMGYRPQ